MAECTSKSLPVPHPYPIHRTAGTNKFGCIWLEVRSPPSAWGWTHLELHLYHYMICRLRPYRTASGSPALASACVPKIENAFADHPELFAVSTAVRNECSVQPPAHLAQPPTAGALEVGDQPGPSGLPENAQMMVLRLARWRNGCGKLIKYVSKVKGGLKARLRKESSWPWIIERTDVALAIRPQDCSQPFKVRGPQWHEGSYTR